jgi:hypothetical protein
MKFYSADIEMLMSGWNTLYLGISRELERSDALFFGSRDVEGRLGLWRDDGKGHRIQYFELFGSMLTNTIEASFGIETPDRTRRYTNQCLTPWTSDSRIQNVHLGAKSVA